MDIINIKGLNVTPLNRIKQPLGDVYHGMKQSDPDYMGFGEAYFSTVLFKKIKGWKKHTELTLNIIVPIGSIKFVLYDDRNISNVEIDGKYYSIVLSPENYCRLTVPPGVWVAFQGIGKGPNILLNIIDKEHDPLESISKDIKDPFFKFSWDRNE